MKKITLLSFCIFGFLFGPQSQAAETTKIIKTFAESTEKVELATGSGQIKGQLFDADTQQTIDAGLTFEAYLYHKLPRLGQWVYASRVEVVGGGFIFDALPDGQYAVRVIWQGAFEYEQVEKFYLPALWSHAGTQEDVDFYQRTQFTGGNIISLNEEDVIKNISLYLEQGALFELSHPGNFNDYNNQAFAYAEELGDRNFRNSLFSIINTQIGNNGQGSSHVNHIFVLPEAKYQFYVTQPGRQDHLLGWGSCQNCRHEIYHGHGEKVNLQKQGSIESRLISLELNRGKILGSFEGESETKYITAISMDKKNANSGFADQNNQFQIDYLETGYYFLHIKPYFSSNYDIGFLFGGSHCFHRTCEFEDSRIVKVDNTSVSLPPMGNRKGGIVSGTVKDNLSVDGNLIPEIPDNDHLLHWISFYDENHKLVSDKEVNEGGYYQIALPAGKYYVRTGNAYERVTNRGYINQVYPGVDCQGQRCEISQGQLIIVTEGEETSGIDFELKRGHVISGAIYAEDHNYLSIPHARIEIYDDQKRFLMDVDTLSDGTFAIGGLQDGHYYLKTNNGKKYHQFFDQKNDAFAWLDEAYPDIPCPDNSCDFELAELVEVNGADVQGVNFNLHKTQAITGWIKEKYSGIPVKNATINVHNMGGELIGTYKSNPDGWFATNGLAVDSQIKNYLLTVEGGPLYYNQTVGGVHCIYGLCSPEQAAAVELNGEPITIELKHKKQVDEKYSGMFYNAEESGHGLQFEVISQSEGQVLNVAWFAHKDGEPMWLTGTGMLLGNRAFVDLQITDGTEFPASKNGQYWGTLRVTFTDLHHADLMWDTQFEGFESGELSVERLTVVSEATESDQETTDFSACMSGSYYDPERSGEGALIEILGEPEDRLLFTWYTYKGDKQFWITGSDYFDGDEFTTQVYYSRGVGFTPDFDASAVETVIWGDVKLKRISMSEVAMLLTPNAQHAADFDVKSTTLTRLTVISGDDGACGLQ